MFIWKFEVAIAKICTFHMQVPSTFQLEDNRELDVAGSNDFIVLWNGYEDWFKAKIGFHRCCIQENHRSSFSQKDEEEGCGSWRGWM